jgi:2-keto-myo-inositol isomerase
MDTSTAAGCRRIVLCPVNDSSDKRSPHQQHIDLVSALNHYAPLFEQYGMIGLVEPLGFEICSVRFKKQAVSAIAETGLSRYYQIVHDTFHHYLSGEEDIFPEETGLIHASGVHAGKKIEEITDDDRYLVDERDIMDNKGQISKLYAGGFQGIMSFEPFSSEVQKLSVEEIESQVRASMNYLFS